MRRLVGVLAVAALVAAATASAVDRDHWINAISIGRAELGYQASGYEALFGRPSARSTTKLAFAHRRIEVWLDHRGRGIGIFTTNPRDRTLDNIGPGSTERAFLRAYPNTPHRRKIYFLGRLLFFTPCGRVTVVLLKAPELDVYEFGARCPR